MLIANTPSFCCLCHAAPFCASCQFRIEDLHDVSTGDTALLKSLSSGLHAAGLLGLGWGAL